MFIFKDEDGIPDLVRSRGLGDRYKRQAVAFENRHPVGQPTKNFVGVPTKALVKKGTPQPGTLYTSDAADDTTRVSSVSPACSSYSTTKPTPNYATSLTTPP